MSMELNLYRNPPEWQRLRTAAIGCSSFTDTATAARLLVEACRSLRAEGFECVIGPMDGNTWGRYRLQSWTDGSPAFAMEPDGSASDLESYLQAGFEIIETHSSATAATGSRGWRDVAKGVEVISWDGIAPEQLLARAHSLVSQGFAQTPFYTPLPREHFVGAYLPLLAKADPHFILEARTPDGQTVGLTLAFPDPLRQNAVVLKTYVGSLPGVGRAMADRVHALALEFGYSEVIHALMRDGIVSLNQSRKFGGRVFRKYVLMGKLL